MLRHLADLKTLAYLGLIVAVFAILWFFGFDADGSLNVSLCAPLLTLLCLLAIANAVISHNHNHAPIFRDRWANLLVGCVISFFYGFPSFCWVPTHNQNHHAFNNRPGDYSNTTRPRRRVGLVGALLYPTVTLELRPEDLFRQESKTRPIACLQKQALKAILDSSTEIFPVHRAVYSAWRRQHLSEDGLVG